MDQNLSGRRHLFALPPLFLLILEGIGRVDWTSQGLMIGMTSGLGLFVHPEIFTTSMLPITQGKQPSMHTTIPLKCRWGGGLPRNWCTVGVLRFKLQNEKMIFLRDFIRDANHFPSLGISLSGSPSVRKHETTIEIINVDRQCLHLARPLSSRDIRRQNPEWILTLRMMVGMVGEIEERPLGEGMIHLLLQPQTRLQVREGIL
jgi:hypothetical protein